MESGIAAKSLYSKRVHLYALYGVALVKAGDAWTVCCLDV